MANQEHVDILRQGVEVWNAWREEHPEVRPYLWNVDLSDTNLRYINLSKAILGQSNLSHTNLSNANLRGANFWYTDLISANLSHSDLSYASLTLADLSNAELALADLSNAKLNLADFSNANLSGANLSHAYLSYTHLIETLVGPTIFGNLDLSTVIGLETVDHYAPSTIGIDTIYRSGGNIPESFLRGAGVPETFITYALSLVSNPIEFYSCFISYSSKDLEFAKRLHADLQANNVRCWYAPHDMKTGDRIRPRIYEQIWFNDKLLLILSESSVTSEWVDYEVETALARERKENRDILFPIRLDDAVMKSTTAWAAHIQDARQITDFTRWKEHDEYQKGLKRLLRDLKQEALHDTIESNADQD